MSTRKPNAEVTARKASTPSRGEAEPPRNPSSAAVAEAAGGPMPRIPSPEEHEKIARLAYELWERQGRPTGRDLDDWLEAERQVRGEDEIG